MINTVVCKGLWNNKNYVWWLCMPYKITRGITRHGGSPLMPVAVYVQSLYDSYAKDERHAMLLLCMPTTLKTKAMRVAVSVRMSNYTN